MKFGDGEGMDGSKLSGSAVGQDDNGARSGETADGPRAYMNSLIPAMYSMIRTMVRMPPIRSVAMAASCAGEVL